MPPQISYSSSNFPNASAASPCSPITFYSILKKFAKIALNHKIEEVVEIEEEVIWALGWDFESHFWAEFWFRFWGPFLTLFWSILNRGFACFTGLFRFRWRF
jgi:hypothetical protein